MFEKEKETFQRELPALLADEGRYALVRGDEVLGAFDTFRDAVEVGYDRCGLETFMVKRIEAVETVHVVTRLSVPCST